MLILDRQDGWQLTVKINLCSCLAASEWSTGVSRIRGQLSVNLNTPTRHIALFLVRRRHEPKSRLSRTSKSKLCVCVQHSGDAEGISGFTAREALS